MGISSRITALAQNFKRLFENNPVTIAIGIIVFLIGATTTIINDGGELMHKANSSFGWRSFEENIVNSLNASISIEKFQENLVNTCFIEKGKMDTRSMCLREEMEDIGFKP